MTGTQIGIDQAFIRTILEQSTNFSNLDENTTNQLVTQGTLHHFNKGEFIFMDGDSIHSYFIVLNGMVSLFKQSPCGKNFTITIMRPGDTLNDITIFNDEPIFVSAEALQPTTVLSIGKKEFLTIVASNPILTARIMKTVGKRVKSIMDRVMYMLADKAEHRVCKVVMMLCSEYGTVLPFTHQEIADLAGVTRETVSRAVAHLQNLGITHSFRGSTSILDKTRLQQLCHDSVDE